MRAIGILSVALSCSAACATTADPVLATRTVDRGSEVAIPTAPNYDDDASWAALPDREDGADRVPPGEEDGQRASEIDVFFVHPTTYYARPSNAAFDDERASGFVDTLVLLHQAAVFNAVGRVFAPRYRQATIWTFTTRDEREGAIDAMALAYSDVRRAFEEFLTRSDRPFIVAGHSQGSYHALRLLSEVIDADSALRARFVAAYLVGIPIPTDVFTRSLPHFPPCRGIVDTGCVVTWNTVAERHRPTRLRRRLPIFYPGAERWESTAQKELQCFNPIHDVEGTVEEGGWSPLALHRGGVLFVDPGGHPIAPSIEAGLTRSRCIDGVLEVEASVPFRYRSDPLGRDGDLHLADYPLFYMDVRRDAEDRTAAYLAREFALSQ